MKESEKCLLGSQAAYLIKVLRIFNWASSLRASAELRNLKLEGHGNLF